MHTEEVQPFIHPIRRLLAHSTKPPLFYHSFRPMQIRQSSSLTFCGLDTHLEEQLILLQHKACGPALLASLVGQC